MSLRIPTSTPYVRQSAPAQEWIEIHPRCNELNGKYYDSHRRRVFISPPAAGPSRFVVKIETGLTRIEKQKLVLPHAEEIAYKTCKLFHWNTVPKTKILHQFTVLDVKSMGKYLQYVIAMNFFRYADRPITFTFQGFVQGTTLPNSMSNVTQDPNLFSFQKAYLLGIVLGKFDARGDNTIFNHKTGELFEIDNEYIGKKGYEDLGILNAYEKLKGEEISPQILNDVLNTRLSELAKIRDKYKVRDEHLIALWSKEPPPTIYHYGREEREEYWSTIIENFKFMRMSIRAFKEKAEPITIEKLERDFNHLRSKDRSPKVFHADPLGRTCLHQALIYDREGRFIEMCIKAGALIDQKDNNSVTPLDVAILVKNVRAVEILIKNSAKVSPKNHRLLEDPLFASVHKLIGIPSSHLKRAPNL